MLDLTKVSWSRLYYFYIVGKCSNITEASYHANLDQSAMSRQIMALEKEVGTKLLIRSNSGVRFTEVGERIYDTVCKMVLLTMKETRELNALQNDVSGALRILTTQTGAKDFIQQISGFYDKFPDIQMHFNIAGDLDPTELLENHDIAIFIKTLEHPELEYIPYKKLKQRIFASKEYLEKHGTPQKPEDLDNHKLITFASLTTPKADFVDFHLTVGKKNKEIRKTFLQVGSVDSLIYACKQGMGIITYVDEEEFSLPDNFVKILEDYTSESFHLYFIYNKKYKELRKIKEFIDFFKKI